MGKYWALRSAYTQRVLGYSDLIRLVVRHRRLGCRAEACQLSQSPG